ncbi:protein penguin [Condylostylus longicornis]|uniref:protein penguin n=1 Tax=Condylostylus longicornis TaxID=2530218 RepID=UPI00244E1C11|nr:protein penguin [Condylostylus longicornis]
MKVKKEEKKIRGSLERSSKIKKRKDKNHIQKVDLKSSKPTFSKLQVLNSLKNEKSENGEKLKRENDKKMFGKSYQKSKFNSEEKTNWPQFKKEKKILKIKRKEGKYKDLSTLIKEVKVIYEKLKCRNTPNKDELSEKLFDLLLKANCMQKFVLAHDTSRIIQCLFRYAPQKIRNIICSELLPITVSMMQSRYAHFCITTMLKYASEDAISQLIESLYGSVIKLCSHNIAGKIMDTIYFEKASKNQKICLRQEFYSDLLVKMKDLNVQKLNDAYNIVQNSKEFILENVKNKLTHLVNKNAMDNSLVHEILLEYIEECREGKSKENCDEFIKICIPVIPHLVTTKNGAKSAIYIFWYSPTKERRAILKILKDHLLKICTHEHGHQLILAIVNGLDDTKAVKKLIIDPLMESFHEILTNQYGRKVLHWLISPADKEIFHPNFINFLDNGLIYSKKDKKMRRNEIFEQIEQLILEKIKENPRICISNSSIGLLVSAFLKEISGDKSREIFQLISMEISSPTWKVENCVEELAIEDTGMHHVLKKILKQDITRKEKGEATLAEELLKNLSDNTIGLWIAKNRGCFVLILLFEALDKEKQEYFKKNFKLHTNTLEKSPHTGAKILLQKIKS